ncbi:MAG: hypothetical protein LBO78_02390 [Rickettsiales bacterium]|jgi:hypothetical protein|nr:hypothetical protein [Rickettsiales bacterium]
MKRIKEITRSKQEIIAGIVGRFEYLSIGGLRIVEEEAKKQALGEFARRGMTILSVDDGLPIFPSNEKVISDRALSKDEASAYRRIKEASIRWWISKLRLKSLECVEKKVKEKVAMYSEFLWRKACMSSTQERKGRS